MKKTIAMLIAAILLTAALVTDIVMQWHYANLETMKAYKQGRLDAIYEMEVFTVDLYDPENPQCYYIDNKCYDQIIYIELDGEIYTHGMIQG